MRVLLRYDIFARFYQYLKERFPLKEFISLSLVLALTAGACVQVHIYRNVTNILPLFLGFIAFLLFLLRLRLFDEFKDLEHDRVYYPSRPVPRGLITLKELRVAIALTLCAEVSIAVVGGYNSLLFFSAALFYSLLMFKEFFAKSWLRNHFTLYILSHELLIFPLFLYIFSLNGLDICNIGRTYFWILTLFFGCQLFLLEVSRKIRAAESEILSRDTYTAQYGIRGASALTVFLIFAVLALGCVLENSLYGKITVFGLIPLLVSVAAIFTVSGFLRDPTALNAKKILNISIVYVVAVDLVLITQSFLRPYGKIYF